MARIFICDDTAQPQILSQAAENLRQRGHDIVRGPANDLGKVKEYSPAERAALIERADVAVFTARHACTRAVMEEARGLRGVCYLATGVDTLDLRAANDLGLIVGHGAVRGNVVGMAESTLMLMLMLLYDVEAKIQQLGAGEWRGRDNNTRQMEGKTIGLVGFGRIARELASRLALFNVQILAASPRARQRDLPPGVTKVALEELMARSDIVSILTGLTAETRHLIGAGELALMKPAAYIVNTSRGEVIDEHALYHALRDRRIAGAALDTFAEEPLPANSALRSLGNVILTPHSVGHTIESLNALGPALVENILHILAGELPPHCKNPEAEPAWRQRLQRLENADAEGIGP